MKTECSLCTPKQYGTLELSNFAEYWEMLGCVPPRHQAGGRFAVGEPYADRWQFGGEFPDDEQHHIVYACYFAIDGDNSNENGIYVFGYFTLKDYKAVTQGRLLAAAGGFNR